MKQIMKPAIMAMAISFFFIACNNEEKTPAASNDSTQTKTTMTDNSTKTQDMDAVKAAPNLYKVVADTMGIRMVDVNYKTGDSSAMHWHPDYVIYAVEGGTATFYAKDGSKMNNELKAGMTLIRPGESHSVKNNGKTNIHVMLVEVNRKGQMSSPDAKLDATKVAPNLYKTVADTMGIRVVAINYKPGEKSAMHSHPDLALYVTEPGTAEFTKKDGTKQTMNLTKGMTAIVPADTHSVKNTGKTTLKGILVEVYRGM